MTAQPFPDRLVAVTSSQLVYAPQGTSELTPVRLVHVAPLGWTSQLTTEWLSLLERRDRLAASIAHQELGTHARELDLVQQAIRLVLWGSRKLS